MTHRDDLEDSEYDDLTLATLAHELYDSDAFEADLRAALRDVLRDHVDASDVVDDQELDFTAEHTFEERLFKDGRGGMFLLRGALVTNAEADLAPGDVVRMQSAKDPEKTIHYVVNQAEPDRYRTSAIRVDPEKNEKRHKSGGLHPGHVAFDDRYEVSRVYRDSDDRPWKIARDLLEDLREAGE